MKKKRNIGERIVIFTCTLIIGCCIGGAFTAYDLGKKNTKIYKELSEKYGPFNQE
jgi:hypothetical protein